MKRNWLLTLVLAVVMAGSAMAQGPQRPHHPQDHQRGGHRPPVEERHRPMVEPCATPEQMAVVLQTLDAQSFDDKKLEIAKLCVTIGHFCVDDLARMSKGFAFDDNRLKFLIYAYDFCSDPERYPMLRDSFAFESNFRALLDAIYPR